MSTKRIFNQEVTPEVFKELQETRRHLFIKHEKLLMPGDTLLVTQPDSRDQLSFDIVSIDYGPNSKHVNSHYSLLGLYAPYTQIDDVTGGPLDRGAIKNLSQREGL